MKIEIIKGAENNPVAEFFSSSSTPETDKFKIKFKTPCGEKYWVPVEHSERLERERDEARDVLSEIALYLSVGMGDETTTAKQYKERILEGIKILTDPLMDRIKESEKKIVELTRETRELQSQVYYEQLKPYKLECEKGQLIEELEYHKEMLKECQNLTSNKREK
jgi:hypothetical protein